MFHGEGHKGFHGEGWCKPFFPIFCYFGLNRGEMWDSYRIGRCSEWVDSPALLPEISRNGKKGRDSWGGATLGAPVNEPWAIPLWL